MKAEGSVAMDDDNVCQTPRPALPFRAFFFLL
jgi:hypothetical protein